MSYLKVCKLSIVRVDAALTSEGSMTSRSVEAFYFLSGVSWHTLYRTFLHRTQANTNIEELEFDYLEFSCVTASHCQILYSHLTITLYSSYNFSYNYYWLGLFV